jgi:hypothetical protein
MHKSGMFLFAILSFLGVNLAHAQYDVQLFGKELHELKNRIEQKKVVRSSAGTTAATAATLPDTLSNDLPELLSRQIGACQKTMDEMAALAQAKMKRSESWAIAGAVTGLLGSVAAGHISTIVVGLLSGTAGLANTVQQVYKDNGDTPEAVLTTRSGIRKQAVTAIDEYTKATDDDQRYNAMVKLNFACAMYEMTSEGKLTAPSGK